jgi:hypothetical protein
MDGKSKDICIPCDYFTKHFISMEDINNFLDMMIYFEDPVSLFSSAIPVIDKHAINKVDMVPEMEVMHRLSNRNVSHQGRSGHTH